MFTFYDLAIIQIYVIALKHYADRYDVLDVTFSELFFITMICIIVKLFFKGRKIPKLTISNSSDLKFDFVCQLTEFAIYQA